LAKFNLLQKKTLYNAPVECVRFSDCFMSDSVCWGKTFAGVMEE